MICSLTSLLRSKSELSVCLQIPLGHEKLIANVRKKKKCLLLEGGAVWRCSAIVTKYRLNVGTRRLSIFLKQRNMHVRQITHNQLIIIIFVNIKSQKIIKSNTSIGYYMTSFVVQNIQKNVSLLLLSKHHELRGWNNSYGRLRTVC